MKVNVLKVNVPLTTEALARVDKFDAMIVKLRDSLPRLNRDERHKCEKTIKSLRHKLKEECVDALGREYGAVPMRSKSGSYGYRVMRDADGKVNTVVWAPAVDS
jgi:hypothetical protein